MNLTQLMLLAEESQAAEQVAETVEASGGNHLILLITVFVLAVFIGFEIITKIPPTLHTPLMSVTNAISGIIVVGGLLQAGSGNLNAAAVLGTIAILVASINIAGGFLVTQRMLAMFRK